MHKLIIISSLLLSFTFSHAQNVGEVFCDNHHNDDGSVMIKWLYRYVYHPDGFNVYRADAGGTNWTQLNDSPVKAMKSMPSELNDDSEASDLFKAMQSIEYERFKTEMVRAFVLIKAIYSNELARAIGILYIDKTTVAGKSYRYKITLASDGSEVAVGKPFTVGPYKKAVSVEDVKLSRSKKRADISWKPDLYRYYAVDVYRKSGEDSEFIKITKVPRAIQKDQANEYSDKSVFFQDTSIVYEENYFYKFRAIDYFGQESEFSEEYAVPAKDLVPPTAVYNLIPTASSVNQNVRLDWEFVNEEDLAGFHVYHSSNPDSEFERITKELLPPSKSTFSMNTDPGGHYYYVSSVDQAGNENPGGMVFVEVRDITPPSAPTGLKAESGEGFITLTWASNSEGDLKGYIVQRSINDEDNSDNAYINVNKEPIEEPTYTEKLPKNVRNKFVYRIVAIDTSFNRSKPSANSLAQMPDVIGPKAPLIKSVVVDTISAVVEWLPNVDADLKGYNIYRSIKSAPLSIEKVNFNLVPPTVNSYTDRSVASGAHYSYYVEAVDQSENSSGKSIVFDAVIPERPAFGLLVITNQKYNSKKKILTLSWKAEMSGEIRGFVVYTKNADNKMKPISGLIQDTYFQHKTESEEGVEYMIRCYSTKGDIINSEPIKIN